jgi:hypothetical protein
LRGVEIMQQLVCTDIPPAPADADTSNPAEKPGAATKTNRALFEAQTAGASCQACHRNFDPYGYALENYDASGTFRQTDAGQAVNVAVDFVSGDLLGRVNGPIELSRGMAGSAQVQQCAGTNWFRYASGRDVAADDRCTIEGLTTLVKDGKGFLDMVMATVATPQFLN